MPNKLKPIDFENDEEFGRKVQIIRDNVKKNINNLKSNGKKLIGYGSPAKATTALNFFGISEEIDFIVEDNNVITPKLSENLLPGVTRDLIINLARQSGKQVSEEDISSDRLISADEIWCSSSTNYVVPITKVDDVIIQNGKVGDTTKEFYNLVTKYIQEL
mgnify:CR=1 FL=1